MDVRTMCNNVEQIIDCIRAEILLNKTLYEAGMISPGYFAVKMVELNEKITGDKWNLRKEINDTYFLSRKNPTL